MNAFFGGAGFSLPWRTRAAVGLYPGAEELLLVRLCAPEEGGGAWTVAESHTAEYDGTASLDAAGLASIAHRALSSAGWADLPLALALPAGETETAEMELPAVLAGEEMRDALLWSLRAEADADGRDLSDNVLLCCARLSEKSDRCWAAWMDGVRVQEFFAAFAEEGLCLRRLTVCPPGGGAYAPLIDAAHEPCMPWEAAQRDFDEQLPAVYAALLLRPGTKPHLYWAQGKPLASMIRSYAAAIITVLSTAVFFAAAAADIAGCAEAQRACTAAEEELALRDADVRRMQAYAALRSDTAQREQMLAAFSAVSLPVRALLVHLGSVTADGVHFTGIQAEKDVRIEGVAANYEALSALMAQMEEARFFSSDIMLREAGQEQDRAGQIRFVLNGW